ncbi:MAG: hypothetical protein IIZ10_01175 [Solobacterium sp.]|nr:hypothetical protein [Solobacterium sp.]
MEVKKIAMRSLLPEAEKKKIREEVTLKVDVTAVLNVMETLHLSYEDAVSELKIPAERQAAVLKKVLEQKQND